MIEAQLIAKLKEGNQQAFIELIDLYKHLVFNTVLNMVMNFEEAEDITQEVFIQVFQSIQSFRGDSKLTNGIFNQVYKPIKWNTQAFTYLCPMQNLFIRY